MRFKLALVVLTALALAAALLLVLREAVECRQRYDVATGEVYYGCLPKSVTTAATTGPAPPSPGPTQLSTAGQTQCYVGDVNKGTVELAASGVWMRNRLAAGWSSDRIIGLDGANLDSYLNHALEMQQVVRLKGGNYKLSPDIETSLTAGNDNGE
jgi:hypothetical protein